MCVCERERACGVNKVRVKRGGREGEGEGGRGRGKGERVERGRGRERRAQSARRH